MKFWDDTVIEILIIMGENHIHKVFLVKLIYFILKNYYIRTTWDNTQWAK